MGSEEGYKEVTEALEGTVSVREILSYIDSDRYMTLERVLEYLPLSERNIRERLPEIPHYRVGKRLLFKKSELDLWTCSTVRLSPGLIGLPSVTA